ncbi:MAG TPA: DUF2851 family protein [Verrucomicrobiae bacterium]|nr:DUF2851 family protein [Verrucomicrobiae bacterium]
MSLAGNSFYASWRRPAGLPPALREGGAPPEQLLQHIWQQQRLRREHLSTLDGRPVRILHPGFHNREGGPDFRGAVVQFGEALPVNGDIEIDLEVNGWHAHGHDRNPAFRSVILHVVWSARKTPSSGPPVLSVGAVLDSPLAELAIWLGGAPTGGLPEALQGRCAAPLRELDHEPMRALLQQAAQVRLAAKAAQLAARARDAGWEQSLWEGLFRALGYKHNSWAMQRLAELRSRWFAGADSVAGLQARLLGVANLLPLDLTRARPLADGFVRQLWDRWWRERDVFTDCQLPRPLWRLHGIRPVNHPQRRLALAAHWLMDDGFVGRLEQWCADQVVGTAASGAGREARSNGGTPAQRVHSLARVLQPARDDFWTHHLTLRSARAPRPQPLLGEARVTDLAVNVILPWLWARAAEGGNAAWRNALETCYHTWPAGEDNATLKLARQRLLGGAPRFRTASAQQGLLQIVRDFCDHSNAICADCRFPELVRSFVS